MKKIVANKLIDFLQKHTTISDQNRDIYLFGLELYIDKACHILLILAISLLYRRVLEGAVFVILYSLIRKLAGGYHAKTSKGCLLFTVFIINIVLYTISHFDFSNTKTFLFSILGSMFIYFIAPVDCLNKPVTEQMIKPIKRRLLFILCSIVLVYGILCNLNYSWTMVFPCTIFIQMLVIILGLKDSPRIEMVFRNLQGE